MSPWLSDELIRAQAMIGALFVFSTLRVIAAALAYARGWRIVYIERGFIVAAVLYCTPQLLEWYTWSTAPGTFAELQGNALGCAIALFCAPILSHRLGYE